jgi:hypothetical protein
MRGWKFGVGMREREEGGKERERRIRISVVGRQEIQRESSWKGEEGRRRSNWEKREKWEKWAMIKKGEKVENEKS